MPNSARPPSSEPSFSRRSRIEAMQELASALSFELTDRITVVQHKSEQLKKALASGKSQDGLKELEKIQKISDEIAALAKGMRSLGLLGEASQLQKKSLPEMAEGILAVCRPWFEKAGIAVHFEAAPPVELRCRPEQISQAVLNLLNNALEASSILQDAKVTLGFSLVGKSPVRLLVSVTDEGHITEAVQKKMLQPFFTTKAPGKGLGLGLNVAKSVAEAHAGKLYQDLAHPTTRFVLELPTTPLTSAT